MRKFFLALLFASSTLQANAEIEKAGDFTPTFSEVVTTFICSGVVGVFINEGLRSLCAAQNPMIVAIARRSST